MTFIHTYTYLHTDANICVYCILHMLHVTDQIDRLMVAHMQVLWK